MPNLTASDSAFSLSVEDLYDNPQQVQGYAVDDAFSTDAVKPAEVVMGVDGLMSGGYTPYPTVLHIMLQADSPSVAIFDNWLQAQAATQSIYRSDATILVPGLGQQWTFTKGYLTESSPMPSAKKIMQPRAFTITFQNFSSSPI